MTNNLPGENSSNQWLDELSIEPELLRDATNLHAIGVALDEVERAHSLLKQTIEAAEQAGESSSAIRVVLETSTLTEAEIKALKA